MNPPAPPPPEQSPERQHTTHLVLLLATLAFLMLVGVGWTVVSLNHEVNLRREQVQVLTDVAAEVNHYARAAVELETSQRGFLLTGDAAYLQPFERGRAELRRLGAMLHARLAGEPEALALLRVVDATVRQKVQELDMSVTLYREQGAASALAFLSTDLGRALMDDLREHFDALGRLLRARMVEIQEQAAELAGRRDVTSLTLLMLGICAGAAVLYVFRAYLQGERAIEQARLAAWQATAQNREKSAFMANMSHEIRTPMNAIFGFTQLLGELVQGEREQFYVRAISQSGKALLGLINDILDMSRIEAGKLELDPQPTDLREMLSSVCTLFSQMAVEKGLRIQVEAAPELPAALLLDPLRTRQVLLNLVGNAVKYTDDGRVTLRAQATMADDADGHVDLLLEVEDSGIGIPPEQLAGIFEPFTQAHSGNHAPRSGSGLGLSIVQRLVTLMQGHIEVESRVDRGSCFRVHLPRVPLALAPPVEPRPARLEELPPLKILVVDDVELNRRLLEGLLASPQHQVSSAAGGVPGVERTLHERPDLVLMDIRMPDLDGVSALQRIRAHEAGRGVKVIAVTASSLLGEEGRLRQLFDGYIRKPVTREALYGEIGKLFGSVGGPGNESGDCSPAPPAALDEASREALLQQRAHIEAALREAVATLSTDQVRTLVQAVHELPRAPALQPFASLADEIQLAASLFDVVTLEQKLAELGDLLAGVLAQARARLAEPPENCQVAASADL